MIIPRPTSRQPIPDHARRAFKGELFDVYQWEQTLFDGATATFEKLRRPDTAYVIPITPDNRLLLAEQKQPGSAPYVGLLGGRIEQDESPDEAARRELLEEAGLETDSLLLWDSYQFLPKLDWAIFTFVARQCRQTKERPLDAGERIGVLQVTFDEFIELVKQERFGDLEVALRVLRIAANPSRMKKMREIFLGPRTDATK